DTGDFPVESVSWDEAQEFCKKLNARPAEWGRGVTYRLPTEAEWEYACRGGHLIPKIGREAYLPFHFEKPSASLGDGQANFDATRPYYGGKKGERSERTNTVGKNGEPNALGLYDVHGNVHEWCQDWFVDGYYKRSPKKDPRGPERGQDRVCRGG